MDLIISSNANMVNDVQVLEHLGNSDQNILVWNLICGVGLTKIKKKLTRKYYKAEYISMREWFKIMIGKRKWRFGSRRDVAEVLCYW